MFDIKSKYCEEHIAIERRSDSKQGNFILPDYNIINPGMFKVTQRLKVVNRVHFNWIPAHRVKAKNELVHSFSSGVKPIGPEPCFSVGSHTIKGESCKEVRPEGDRYKVQACVGQNYH